MLSRKSWRLCHTLVVLWPQAIHTFWRLERVVSSHMRYTAITASMKHPFSFAPVEHSLLPQVMMMMMMMMKQSVPTVVHFAKLRKYLARMLQLPLKPYSHLKFLSASHVLKTFSFTYGKWIQENSEFSTCSCTQHFTEASRWSCLMKIV